MREKERWMQITWWKKQANEIGMENKEGKKAYLRYRWQRGKYSKEKEGESKGKGKKEGKAKEEGKK